MLGTDTLLSLDGDHRVRLSYVLEDDSGCSKGLTVRRLLPDPSPPSYQDSLSRSRRLEVRDAQGRSVGILDPEPRWSELSGAVEFQDRKVIPGGAMTCVFTILENVRNPSFLPASGHGIADLANYVGEATAYILGEGRIGTIPKRLNYLRWKGQYVYPLLRLERSDEDLAAPTRPIRNGAMVTTDKGDLVGIIVSIFDKGKSYAVAPFRDVLEWHRLRFIRNELGELEQPSEPIVPRDCNWNLPRQTDPRLLELVEP